MSSDEPAQGQPIARITPIKVPSSVAIDGSVSTPVDEQAEEARVSQADTGLDCVLRLLRFHGIPCDAGRIRNQYAAPGAVLSEIDILRCLKEHGLIARNMNLGIKRLERIPLPALGQWKDGGYFIIAKASENEILIHDPREKRPSIWKNDELTEVWNGDIIPCTKRQATTEEQSDFDLSWFIPSVVRYRKMFGEVMLASFLIQVFALITPLFFLVIIDKVLVHRGLSTLDVLILALIMVAFFDAGLNGLRTYLFAHTTNRIDVELGAKLFRHLLALPMSYFEARQSGHIEAQVRELDAVRNFLTGPPLTVVIDLLFTVVFLVLMYYYSPLLTFIVLGAIPLYIILTAVISPILRGRLQDKSKRGAENHAFLAEMISGIGTVKAMAVEPQMRRRWEEQLAGYVQSSFKSANVNTISSQGTALINKVATAIILYVAAREVMAGNMTVGQMVAFNMLATRVNAPILRLAQIWQEFQQISVSMKRLSDILNNHPEPSFSADKTTLPSIKGEVTFDDVTFRYTPDGAEILRGLTLTIPAGQMIGVIGPSGSGKSTLTKMIQRLHVPEKGRVSIDGADLAMIDTAWLRRQVGVVSQDSFLLNTSIRENIALIDPSMPIERVYAAAILAGAHDFIMALPNGYDTTVGDRGQSLSGGQRQRIAIARTLITNPRILVLDEVTSALDYESERVVRENLHRIAAGRTVIIITHRLAMLRDADRIISIEDGRVSEDGVHEDLVKSEGRYAALYGHNVGEPEKIKKLTRDDKKTG